MAEKANFVSSSLGSCSMVLCSGSCSSSLEGVSVASWNSDDYDLRGVPPSSANSASGSLGSGSMSISSSESESDDDDESEPQRPAYACRIGEWDVILSGPGPLCSGGDHSQCNGCAPVETISRWLTGVRPREEEEEEYDDGGWSEEETGEEEVEEEEEMEE
jgi:hypothetical protein